MPAAMRPGRTRLGWVLLLPAVPFALSEWAGNALSRRSLRSAERRALRAARTAAAGQNGND